MQDVLIYNGVVAPVEAQYVADVSAAVQKRGGKPVTFEHAADSGGMDLAYARAARDAGSVIVLGKDAAEIIHAASMASAVGAVAIVMGVKPWMPTGLYNAGSIQAIPYVNERTIEIAAEIATIYPAIFTPALIAGHENRTKVGQAVQQFVTEMTGILAQNTDLSAQLRSAAKRIEEIEQAQRDAERVQQDVEQARQDAVQRVKKLYEAIIAYGGHVIGDDNCKIAYNCAALLLAEWDEVRVLLHDETSKANS